MNPQLRVEAQVYVLVNDDKAMNFGKLTEIGESDGNQQVLNIPDGTGEPIEYDDSITDPSFNEKGSPLQVCLSLIWTTDTWIESPCPHSVRAGIFSTETVKLLERKQRA